MKKVLCALAILFAGSQSARAQTGVTGTWRAEGVGKGAWTVALRTDGRRLSGTVSSCTSLPVPIYEGKIDGNAITFKCKSLDGDRIISFAGRINGDEITFAWGKEIRDGGALEPAKATLDPGDDNAWETRRPTEALPFPWSWPAASRQPRGPSTGRSLTQTRPERTVPREPRAEPVAALSLAE